MVYFLYLGQVNGRLVTHSNHKEVVELIKCKYLTLKYLILCSETITLIEMWLKHHSVMTN